MTRLSAMAATTALSPRRPSFTRVIVAVLVCLSLASGQASPALDAAPEAIKAKFAKIPMGADVEVVRTDGSKARGYRLLEPAYDVVLVGDGMRVELSFQDIRSVRWIKHPFKVFFEAIFRYTVEYPVVFIFLGICCIWGDGCYL
jgi:hypothetical protein